MTKDEIDLAAWLGSAYALDAPVNCKLLRAYTNDVYQVTTRASRHVLKLYGGTWRTLSEIEYEAALLEHLAQKGLPVANMIVGRENRKITQIPTPEGHRYAVLFEYARGEKPQPPFSKALYFAFGEAIARMHEFSNDFITHHERTPFDLACLLDAPLQCALPWIEKEEDRTALQAIAGKVKTKLAEPGMRGLDWGPIHGDATLDNLHLTEDGGIVLYDFDSGGPGWRAADLQGWAAHQPAYAAKWQAFKRGYASVRELKAPDLEAAPYLAVAWLIWGLQIDLEQRVLKQGKEKIAAYVTRQLDAIKAGI